MEWGTGDYLIPRLLNLTWLQFKYNSLTEKNINKLLKCGVNTVMHCYSCSMQCTSHGKCRALWLQYRHETLQIDWWQNEDVKQFCVGKFLENATNTHLFLVIQPFFPFKKKNSGDQLIHKEVNKWLSQRIVTG